MKAQSFQNGLPVVSSAGKLIFSVPQSTAIATFPNDVFISEYGQNNNSPSIVVHNHIDKSSPEGTWQGADSKEGIVIMNNVPEAVALQLLGMFEADQTVSGLQKVLSKAEELGCLDNYTTKKQFVDDNLSPAGNMLDKYTGIVKRDSRDIALIIRDGSGIIWRKLGDGINHIDTDEILVRDYRNVDGTQIDIASIPTVETAEEAA